MQITAMQTLNLQISKDEQKRITIQTLREVAKWVGGNYIADGQLMLRETYSTTHSWDEDIIVRNASPLDLATDLLIHHILSTELK
jgi:hypothetical protein